MTRFLPKSDSELKRPNTSITEDGRTLQVRSGAILFVDATEGLKAIAHSVFLDRAEVSRESGDCLGGP